MSLPLPTFQAKWPPSHGKVWIKPLHIIETLCVLNLFCLSHAATDWLCKYFAVRTRFQSPSFISANQIFLRRSEILNQCKFLIPQPWYSFGQEMLCRLVQWYFRWVSEDPQRKANIMLLSLCKIEAGIGTNTSQYIGKLESTDWKRISLPPRRGAFRSSCIFSFQISRPASANHVPCIQEAWESNQGT